MTRSVPATRLPALTLALLAVLGLLLRAQPVPAVPSDAMFAAFPMALCHSGPDDKRPADHPAGDCDACLLCQAVHGDHVGTLLLPSGAMLPPVSVVAVVPPVLAGSTARRGIELRGAWARAPPRVG